MSKAEIFAGGCGFTTIVRASMNGKSCHLQIESECKAIQRLAENLTEVNPFQEISFRRESPLTMKMASQYCTHAACPVPAGIIKAVEVEAKLALPVDVSIHLSRTDEP